VNHIKEFDDELTIYAASDWTPDSVVVLAREPASGGLPPEASSAGMRYFLEIFIAKEVLDAIPHLDLEARTKRLIRYAVTDA
jgi:hypothetical protein